MEYGVKSGREWLSMNDTEEKRLHRRLGLSLPLELLRVGHPQRKSRRAKTLNVSTGGLYFETTDDDFRNGESLQLNMAVTPDQQRFPLESTIKTTGKVVRISRLRGHKKDINDLTRYGVAVQFQKSLKLTF